MNQTGMRRFGAMATTGAFALVVLAACGAGGGESATEQVTRVPVASDAATEATTTAAESSPAAETATQAESSPAVETEAATPEIMAESAAATPEAAAGMATPESAGMATPMTAATEATPVAAAQEATPVAAAAEATPAAEAATPVAGAAEATPAAGAGEMAGATAEVVSIDIAFEPKELTIPANTDVTVSLPNHGAAAHNFSIDELGISVDQAPGTTEEVTINAPAGTYQYYCNVPGHKEAGMVGTLTVE